MGLGSWLCVKFGALTFDEFCDFQDSLMKVLNEVDAAFRRQQELNALLSEKLCLKKIVDDAKEAERVADRDNFGKGMY